MSDKSNLLFTKEHEWLDIDGDEAQVGITDFAQGELGDIIFVELPEIGDSFNKDDVFGTIEAVKTVADLFMPVSGEIISINNIIEDNPEMINSNPLDDGWIIKIKITDKSEIDTLLDHNKYNVLINV
ncbi:MAG: glycine cleavage system protein H [Candidatus Marinimicrobia bacterium]|nr:glycine cleavage system protein H [Candidatus Neomarinimicrobiota bacterium]|tara:strand:+ start:5704 stop:6084 length:381 start_codon:yes stop_codon:yes gene_type:complete